MTIACGLRRFLPAGTGRGVAIGVLLAATACTYTAPPYTDLAGTWNTGSNPSGRGLVLALRTRGDSVYGYGFILGLEGVARDSLSVAGRASGTSVWLAVQRVGDAGGTATFSAHVVSSGELDGTWKASWEPSGALRLYRQ